MVRGWILNKPKFHDSYETKRLLEEFKNHNIDVNIIDPNEIDIFVLFYLVFVFLPVLLYYL